MFKGAVVAMTRTMAGARLQDGHYSLNDGLGVRMVASNVRHGLIEMLTVSPRLAVHAGVEEAIRARATRSTDLEGASVAPVRKVDRDESGLRVFSDSPQGVRLSDLLTHLESGTDTLCDAGILELAYAVIRAAGGLHQLPGNLSHGAICPAHAVIAADGTVVLTDSVFGGAIESLQRNREQVWREFGLALPSSASLARFDQRTDVTELGAVVLAIALRAPLKADAYPREVADLVVLATPESAHHGSALRMWLQQALHLHPRLTFSSALDAQHAFAALMPAPGIRRTGKQAMQGVLMHAASFSTLRAS
jgi:hypothetical protein